MLFRWPGGPSVERQIAISTRLMSSSARPQTRDINLTLYLWDDRTHPSLGVFETKRRKKREKIAKIRVALCRIRSHRVVYAQHSDDAYKMSEGWIAHRSLREETANQGSTAGGRCSRWWQQQQTRQARQDRMAGGSTLCRPCSQLRFVRCIPGDHQTVKQERANDSQSVRWVDSRCHCLQGPVGWPVAFGRIFGFNGPC